MDRPEGARDPGVGLVAAQEVVRLGAVVGPVLVRVDEPQVEPPCELADRRVVGVDQLAAVLGDLAAEVVVAARDARAVRMHPAAEPGRRLVDRRPDAVVGERQCGREAGDTAADDRDPG